MRAYAGTSTHITVPPDAFVSPERLNVLKCDRTILGDLVQAGNIAAGEVKRRW